MHSFECCTAALKGVKHPGKNKTDIHSSLFCLTTGSTLGLHTQKCDFGSLSQQNIDEGYKHLLLHVAKQMSSNAVREQCKMQYKSKL